LNNVGLPKSDMLPITPQGNIIFGGVVKSMIGYFGCWCRFAKTPTTAL
jgi:hypothetical protein